ncbi:MAG: 50S ribosomal protein L24 [Bacilli bacterium]
MKIKQGDLVQVIAGSSKDRGKQGKVIKTFAKKDRVVVEGVKLVTKHVKPSQQNSEGGIVNVEAPIHVSNVMIVDPKTKKPTRIGYTTDKDGNKVRVTKASNTVIDK